MGKCVKCGGETEIAEFKNKETGGVEELRECLGCGRLTQPMEVYSRCCGYLRPTKQWNLGKQSEFKARKTYLGETVGVEDTL